MKGCWISSNVFSASNEIIMCFLFLSLFMWWIICFDLYLLNHNLDEADLIIVDNLFLYVLQFCLQVVYWEFLMFIKIEQ